MRPHVQQKKEKKKEMVFTTWKYNAIYTSQGFS